MTISYRGDPWKAKVQFITSAEMPSLIYKACQETGAPSQSVYCQVALCEKLARDLGLDVEELISHLPPPISRANALLDPETKNSNRKQ